MALFRRKREQSEAVPESDDSQLARMMASRIPVFLSKLHGEHPPRWVTVYPDRLESVTGLESPEYMDDAANHEVWSVDHFVSDFPFVSRFLNEVRPGQTALFEDTFGAYTLED